jgi:hypothetical protein
MKISIKTLTGKTYNFEINPENSILDVKNEIE